MSDGLCGVGTGPFHDCVYLGRREKFGIPRHFGVTPTASYVTTAQADEISGFTGVESFALYRVKILDQRQAAAAVEQILVILLQVHKCLSGCDPADRSPIRSLR